MSPTLELSTEDIAFLTSYLPNFDADEHTRNSKSSRLRPFVTLTYACSLDGRIAMAPGARTTLSGAETKAMTHYLRLKHDAILIGVSTAVADNPSLNCRYPGAEARDQPRPVVIDPSRRWHVHNTKLLQLASQDTAKAPWIMTRIDQDEDSDLNRVGGEYIAVSGEDNSQPGRARTGGILSWEAILAALHVRDVKSVMIEGGAKVINELLSRPDLVDSVIITIAPTWLGQGSVAIEPPERHAGGERINAADLKNTSWRQFGHDVVLGGRLT